MKKHLDGINAQYEYLNYEALKKKFPMLQYPDTHQGIFEPTGGLLKADKCSATIQVRWFIIFVFRFTFNLQFYQLFLPKTR